MHLRSWHAGSGLGSGGMLRQIMLGLFVPALVTPLELLGGSHERDYD